MLELKVDLGKSKSQTICFETGLFHALTGGKNDLSSQL